MDDFFWFYVFPIGLPADKGDAIYQVIRFTHPARTINIFIYKKSEQDFGADIHQKGEY